MNNKATPCIAEQKSACCGCGVCEAVCPTGAVTMQPDSEGFMYPVIDAEKCIGCKKCEHHCAFMNDSNAAPADHETEIYAARLTDRNELLASASGGAFAALSRLWLQGGGAVVCCRYDYTDHREKFDLMTDISSVQAARGSVYVQSFPDGIHKRVLGYLEEDSSHRILFVGMGCQAAAFLRLAEKRGFRDRVVVCDIICHGSPSPMLWNEYVSAFEKKHGQKITYVTFKDKTDGWKKPTPYVTAGGKKTEIRDYVKLFYSGCALRPSCHVCPYASVDRNTDITIGDYWGIDKKFPDFYDPDGNSLVIVRTQQGRELFDSARSLMTVMQTDRESCLQKNLEEPTPVSPEREQFWKDFEKGGIELLIKKYGTEKADVRFKKFVKRIIGKK